MKLKGKNFQPWAEFEMEIEGLTVLVGPSNKGKSSLFRALKGILRNEIPEDFVRNNQDEPLEIELTLDDGRTVKAVRARKGSTKYHIFPPVSTPTCPDCGSDDREEPKTVDGKKCASPWHGKKYSSLGGKVPEEIQKLGFGEVELGDYTLDPIFAGQNRAQFLIDSDRWKPNELNAILGAFSSTEKLDSGKREANTRISQHKSEASTLASEIRAAEERSAKLLEITGEASVVAEAVLDLERGIRAHESVVGQLGSAIRHSDRLEPLQAILETLTLPSLTETTVLATKASNLQVAADTSKVVKFLHSLESELNSLADNWKGIVASYKRLGALGDVLEAIRCTGKESPTEYAYQLAAISKHVGEQLTEVKTLSTSISYLAEVIRSAQLYDKFTPALAEVEGQLEDAEAELELVRKELAAEAARKETASKMCPKCGRGLEHVCQQ